jgi:hypothetical protein
VLNFPAKSCEFCQKSAHFPPNSSENRAKVGQKSKNCELWPTLVKNHCEIMENDAEIGQKVCFFNNLDAEDGEHEEKESDKNHKISDLAHATRIGELDVGEIKSANKMSET